MSSTRRQKPTKAGLADALRTSEERYRFLSEEVPVQIWTATPDGALDYVSDQTAHRLGKTPLQLLAEGWQTALHPDDLQRAIERWRHALTTGETYEVEFRLKVAAGEYRWHLARAVPRRGTAGEVVQWFGTNTDIEAQRAQQARVEGLLEELEQQAERLAEQNHLLTLEAEVGMALVQTRGLEDALRACAELVVRHVDAAFVRIWTVDGAGQTLVLRASAGLYTHTDGAHGRVPIGMLKIGQIAAERKAHLTNQVIGDPRVSDQAWAKREGIVAFAGYPLVLGDRLVGVIAAFARHAFSEPTVTALRSIAHALALSIEHRRREDSLRASEAWLSTTLSSVGDGVIAADALGCVSYLNPLAEQLSGWTLSEARGRPIEHVFAVIEQETRLPVRSLRDAVGLANARQMLLVRRDGQEVPIEENGAPLRGVEGEVTGVVLAFRDVTEKRRADSERARLLEETRQAHQEAEGARDRLHALFMQAPTPVCILRGPEHRFELANPMYRELVGNRDVVGMTVREALPDIENQGFFELLDGVYSRGEQFVGVEVPIRIVRGEPPRTEEAILTFVYEPFREASGEVSGILVIAMNVTETVQTRRSIERALAESATLNERLGDAENVLRSLVNNLPDLAWSATPDGTVDFYNQRWFDYTRTTAKDMFERGWEAFHDPAVLPDVVGRWRHSIATGDPFEMEFPLLGGDGSFRWFLTRVLPVRDSAGNIIRWFGTNTDIHEQREAARKLHEASLAKDEFLATASHELRTPLNAILGWARLLRSGSLDASGYLRGVETIERNAKAQVQLIEDILDGSRIITGNLHLEIRPLDMTTLVQAALDAIRPAADAKRIQIALDLDPSATSVLGDPERLQQVVWNLATNAVKFTPTEGTITIRLVRSGTYIELVVADSGKGIRKEFLPHVFERFRQAEGSTTRRYGGLGLGLALVRHLVEAHGGTVRVESEGEGRGATFTVTLPVRAVVAQLPSPERPRPTPTDGASRFVVPASLAEVTVLVVDDEADARELVATVLRANGAEVTTAASAKQAIELLTGAVPRILITDIGMPEVDGYELMRRIRALEGRVAEIPAIALTAYSREQDRRRALEAGFQSYLAKPVEPAELVRAVTDLVSASLARPSQRGEA